MDRMLPILWIYGTSWDREGNAFRTRFPHDAHVSAYRYHLAGLSMPAWTY